MQLLARSRGARLAESLIHDANHRVLYLLETVEVPLRTDVPDAVAMIDPSTDIGSCHRFCRLKGERRSQMSQRPKVEITCMDDVGNVQC